MYLDDSNYAPESLKLAHTEPVLTADRNYRIVREEDPVSRKSRLMIGLVLVFMVRPKARPLINWYIFSRHSILVKMYLD
jgi:hypothetical protein